MGASPARARGAASETPAMRAFLLSIVLLAATGLAGHPAAAAPTPAKPPLTPDRIAPVATTQAPLSAQSVCTIGTSGPAVYVVDYLQPPDDSYYLRVQPSSCATCAGGPGVWISSVR